MDTSTLGGPTLNSLLVFLSLAPLALGQSTQIGGLIGRGGVVQLFENSAYHVVAGVEGCVWCGGRLGLFMEFHHWQKTGEGTDQPVSLDLAGGGLRIQGKGARLRPFFDIGFTAGTEEKDHPILPFNRAHQGVVGGLLGFGVAISITEHWYVRPLGRIIGLSSSEYGGFGGVAVGYRF
jgi:hypothetical protein